MKKKLSIAFLLLSFHLMAQKDTTNFNRSNSNEITYDFLNDHLINPANSCIKNKGIIKLNVKNVNRFLYKDRKSTRLSSHANISYAVFCLHKKNTSIEGKDPQLKLTPSASASALQIAPS